MSGAVGGQHDELRAAMVGIVGEGHQAVAAQVVDDPLNVLAVRPQVPGQPRHRLGTVGRADRPEDLPASARQPKVGDQAVTRGGRRANIRKIGSNMEAISQRSRVTPAKPPRKSFGRQTPDYNLL